jgi:hypothetical protein
LAFTRPYLAPLLDSYYWVNWDLLIIINSYGWISYIMDWSFNLDSPSLSVCRPALRVPSSLQSTIPWSISFQIWIPRIRIISIISHSWSMLDISLDGLFCSFWFAFLLRLSIFLHFTPNIWTTRP